MGSGKRGIEAQRLMKRSRGVDPDVRVKIRQPLVVKALRV
jgi:hypothetical protein